VPFTRAESLAAITAAPPAEILPRLAESNAALAGEGTYLRMVEGAGLPPERYAAWLSETLSALLLHKTTKSPRMQGFREG
jgi:hypothetical protein